MRTALFVTGVLLTVCAGSLFAMNDTIASRLNLECALCVCAGAHVDTFFIGGDGTGTGHPVLGGVWDWEAASAEPPQSFLDGDPVGNEYRDGWTFQDRTARNGPSQSGAGHWRPDGTYDFNFDYGSFAHRATFHANNGRSDGPDPLVGNWSLWIGTNLYLNPEHCGWGRTAGYGDGWSQGIEKSFAVPNGSGGVQYDLSFYHRYACEAAFDTCWIEISVDGVFWNQVGTVSSPNGIFSGGDRAHPQPGPAGGQVLVNLITWPSGQGGTLYVRFRLAADAFVSDNSEGGNFFWAWQVDDIQLLRNSIPVGPVSTFETGMDGWAPKAFVGFDFAITSSERPAGRIDRIANLACPPMLPCPADCGLENRVLLFVDRDDCDLNDSFQDTYATSPAFAIPDGKDGRLVTYDVYLDGGTGLFATGPAICWVYRPFNANHCPYTPAANAPGAGVTFNWSQTSFSTCNFYDQGASADCLTEVIDDLSANISANADSVTLHFGAFSQCRSQTGSIIADNGAPFYDNIRFAVFDRSIGVGSDTIDRFADNFPISNGPITTTTCRTDGSHSLSQNLGLERPLRWVRSDTALTQCTTEATAMFLRFAVELGPCQQNLMHPFFVTFPPSAPGTFPDGLIWHAARMDTAQAHGTGAPIAGRYMTCFHENDPLNGVYWDGAPPSVEPCDDILPDRLFTAGTTVYYFFEAQNAITGSVIGTFPFTQFNAPIMTMPNYRDYWLQINNLPELTPACDGTYANTMLLVNDFQTKGVPKGQAAIQRERLTATLATLGLSFDVYDVVGTDWHDCYDGIGRREDRLTQQPRPPHNGATDLMLDNYDVIWYTGGLLESDVMLSDRLTLSLFGGQPSTDQQKLETWVAGCSGNQNRLLVLDGTGWASFIDVGTAYGQTFLSHRGVQVLTPDYAQDLASNDLRRCARITSSPAADHFDDAEIFGSGCPENIDIDVFTTISSGEAVAHFVESLEDDYDPINCADDVDRPAWLAAVRRTNPAHTCERSASLSFALAGLYPLNCANECFCTDYRKNGENAELIIDLFQWAGQPINPSPIGIDPAEAPRFVNELYLAQPNPANPSATIRYSIARKGHVSLKVFDVSGRLVRTLVDQVQEPATTPFEIVWNGTNDGGQQVGSGVYFYQIDAPGFATSRKLVILK